MFKFRTRQAAGTALLCASFFLGAGILGFTGPAQAADRSFVTSDGVRLHYIDQGKGRTIVMVPGWTMPAWIFTRQIDDLSRDHRVIAFDPRSQGDSDIAPSGHEPFRRGRDIEELLGAVGDPAPLLLGWSLGVLDVLAFVHQFGDRQIAGLVLVDNSVGEEPAPVPSPPPPPSRHPRPPRRPSREESVRAFVRSMFKVPPPEAFIDRLTEASLRTPPDIAAQLLSYPVPRSFWKEAVYSTSKPVLYLVTPRFAGQAANLAAHHPDAESIVLDNVGHAMFVDDPVRFDGLLRTFMRSRLWH